MRCTVLSRDNPGENAHTKLKGAIPSSMGNHKGCSLPEGTSRVLGVISLQGEEHLSGNLAPYPSEEGEGARLSFLRPFLPGHPGRKWLKFVWAPGFNFASETWDFSQG